MATKALVEWACGFCDHKQVLPRGEWPKGWRRWAIREENETNVLGEAQFDMCSSCCLPFNSDRPGLVKRIVKRFRKGPP